MTSGDIHYFYLIKVQTSLTPNPKRLTLPFDVEEEQNGATVEVISNEPRDRRSISTPEPIHDDDDTPLDQLQKGSLPDLVKNIQEKSTSKPQPVVLPVPPSKPPSLPVVSTVPTKPTPPAAVPTVSPKPTESPATQLKLIPPKPAKVSKPPIPLPYPPKVIQTPKPTAVPTKPVELASDKLVCDIVPDLALKEELSSKPSSPPETEDNNDDSDSDDSDIGIPDDLDSTVDELPIPDPVVDSEARRAEIEKAEKENLEAKRAKEKILEEEKLKRFQQKIKSVEGTPKKTKPLVSPPEDRKNAQKEALKESRSNEWHQKRKDHKNREVQEKAAKLKQQFDAEQAEMDAQEKAKAQRIAVAKKQAEDEAKAKAAIQKAEADKKEEEARKKAAEEAERERKEAEKAQIEKLEKKKKLEEYVRKVKERDDKRAKEEADKKKAADEAKEAEKKLSEHLEAKRKELEERERRRKETKKAQLGKWKEEVMEEFMEKYIIRPGFDEWMKENRIVEELFDKKENEGLSFVEDEQINILIRNRNPDTEKLDELTFQAAKESFVFFHNQYFESFVFILNITKPKKVVFQQIKKKSDTKFKQKIKDGCDQCDVKDSELRKLEARKFTQTVRNAQIKRHEPKIPTAPVASIQSSDEKNESLSEQSRKRKSSEIEQERNAKVSKIEKEKSKADTSVLISSDSMVDHLQSTQATPSPNIESNIASDTLQSNTGTSLQVSLNETPGKPSSSSNQSPSEPAMSPVASIEMQEDDCVSISSDEMAGEIGSSDENDDLPLDSVVAKKSLIKRELQTSFSDETMDVDSFRRDYKLHIKNIRNCSALKEQLEKDGLINDMKKIVYPIAKIRSGFPVNSIESQFKPLEIYRAIGNSKGNSISPSMRALPLKSNMQSSLIEKYEKNMKSFPLKSISEKRKMLSLEDAKVKHKSMNALDPIRVSSSSGSDPSDSPKAITDKPYETENTPEVCKPVEARKPLSQEAIDTNCVDFNKETQKKNVVSKESTAQALAIKDTLRTAENPKNWKTKKPKTPVLSDSQEKISDSRSRIPQGQSKQSESNVVADSNDKNQLTNAPKIPPKAISIQQEESEEDQMPKRFKKFMGLFKKIPSRYLMSEDQPDPKKGANDSKSGTFFETYQQQKLLEIPSENMAEDLELQNEKCDLENSKRLIIGLNDYTQDPGRREEYLQYQKQKGAIEQKLREYEEQIRAKDSEIINVGNQYYNFQQHTIKKNMNESQAVNYMNSNDYKNAKRKWIDLKHSKNKWKKLHGIKNNELTVSFPVKNSILI